MKRILKRTQKQLIAALLAGTLVIGSGIGIAYLIHQKQLRNQYQTKIGQLEQEIAQNRTYLYKANGVIAAGDILQEEDVMLSEEFYGLASENMLTEEDLGKRTLIQIDSGQALYKNMIETEMEKGIREMEYLLFRFNSNLIENDLVDVRISYPNGEDKIVLSKKLLKNLDLGTNKCNVWLNEEEILYLSSAIVDAAHYESAYLYTAKYIDSGQEISSITYQPNEDVMLSLANDPNVLEEATAKLNLRARKEMEERIQKSKKEEVPNQTEGDREADTNDTNDTGESKETEETYLVE